MKFLLEITMDNAAFDDPQELARIVAETAIKISASDWDGDQYPVRDVNGNYVGFWRIDV